MALRGGVASPQALGRLLQQARLVNGLSQQQVAERLGISQSYVSELESGKTSLALMRIFEIMRLTGMTLQAEIPESPPSSSTC
jgi:HTH-type transcriptional regulator/antitoxin HipB